MYENQKSQTDLDEKLSKIEYSILKQIKDMCLITRDDVLKKLEKTKNKKQ